MKMPIGERIRAVRIKSGLSQHRYAQSLDFSRRSLLNWEAVIAEPPMAILKPLRMLYNVDPEWIVMGGNLKPECDFRIQEEVYPYDLSRHASTAGTNQGTSTPTEFERRTP